MTCFYEVTVESCKDKDMVYTIYGIALKEGKKIKKEYRDISTQLEFVEEFVRRCNVHELHPCHLADALYDYLP